MAIKIITEMTQSNIGLIEVFKLKIRLTGRPGIPTPGRPGRPGFPGSPANPSGPTEPGLPWQNRFQNSSIKSRLNYIGSIIVTDRLMI